jgi:four helix bundle protein
MSKIYDLGERTRVFAVNCRNLIRAMNRDLANIEDSKQLVRSSGSVAANYIEANEALSKKDFYYRIKVCRKESKESGLWLSLLMISEKELSDVRHDLENETKELIRIFASILSKNDPEA